MSETFVTHNEHNLHSLNFEPIAEVVPQLLAGAPQRELLNAAVEQTQHLQATPATHGSDVVREHAFEVWEKGNKINKLWLDMPLLLPWMVTLSSVATGLHLAGTPTPTIVPVEMGVYASAIAMQLTISKHHRNAIKNKIQAELETIHAIQEYTQLPIEIFKHGVDKSADSYIFLRVETDVELLSNSERAKRLSTIKTTVDQTNARFVYMPADYAPKNMDKPRVNASKSIISKNSRIMDKDVRNDEIVVNRYELNEMTRLALEKVQHETLDTIMAILRKVHPAHPVLREYELLQKYPDAPRDNFKRALNDTINRRFDEAEKTVFISEEIPGTENKPGIPSLRIAQKEYINGRPAVIDGIPKIIWSKTAGGMTTGVTNFFTEVGLSETSLIELLNNHEQLPNSKITELCEYVAWLSEHDVLQEKLDVPGVAVDSRPEKITRKGLKERIFLSSLEGRKAERENDIQINRVLPKIQKWHKIGVLALIAFGYVSGNLNEHFNLPILDDAQVQTQDLTSSLVASVGNVSNSPNKPWAWVTSYNGMSSEGYWQNATIDYIDTSYDEIRWDFASFSDIVMSYKIPNEDKLDKTLPLLKVDIDTSKIIQHIGDNDGYVSINIPVLDGTKLVAAQTDNPDSKLKFGMLENNQQVLLLKDDDDSTTITYWLKPDETKVLKPELPIGGLKSNPLPGVRKAWDDYLDQPLPKKPENALRLTESIIRNDFEYKLNPLETEDSLESQERFTHDVLELQAAVCNVAATLLAISNPSQVAPVAGFLNSNDNDLLEPGRSVLSTNEAHMWTIDKHGEIHDATPINGKTPPGFGAENFDDPFGSHRSKSNDAPLNLLPIGATLAGVWTHGRRRKIAARARNASLRLISERTLLNAHEGLSHAIFADSGTRRDFTFTNGRQNRVLLGLGTDQASTKQKLLELSAFRTQNNEYGILDRQQKRAVRLANRFINTKENYNRIIVRKK